MDKRTSRITLWCTALLCSAALSLLAPRPVHAGSTELLAALHLKILSYDRQLRPRAGKVLVLAVLYKAGSRASEGDKAVMTSAFSRLAARATVQGLTPQILALPYRADDLPEQLKQGRVAALYVADDLEREVPHIAQVSAALRIPTLSGRRRYAQLGLATAVEDRNGKRTIVVNIAAAKSCGMVLASNLLRLAEILH
jgi:hypothetical protein